MDIATAVTGAWEAGFNWLDFKPYPPGDEL